MSDPYGININKYYERHYIKDFVKKYNNRQWQVTEQAIKDLVRRPLKTIRETKRKLREISADETRKICKGEFKVAGTDMSPKSSGNRFIVFVDLETEFSHVLLIYNKQDHVKGDDETAWWKKEIKNTYPKLSDLL